MKIQHLAFDRYEGQDPRIALDLTNGLNVVDARQPLLARQLADLVGHVLYGARVCDRDAIVHDHPGYVDVDSSLGRFRMERHADRANRGTYTEPRLTVAPLEGHHAQPGTARQLLKGLSPEVAARLLVLRRSDDDQLQWLLSESLATELHRIERVHPEHVESRDIPHDASDLFTTRDRLSHQIELLLAEKRRSSEALEAAISELSLEYDAAQHRHAECQHELDEVLARLAELETQLRYHELSEFVGRTADEAYHQDQQSLLADLDEEIAKWRRALAELEAREAQIRQQLSQRHPDDSSPLLPLADQRAAIMVAHRLVADLDSEVARYARPSDSHACLCRHTHARLHPLVDTLGQQIEKLAGLVEQYEAAVAMDQLKLEAAHLERSQQELRATIDHLLDRRQSRMRTSRARNKVEGLDVQALPKDWQRLREDLENQRGDLTGELEEADRHIHSLLSRRDRLHHERAELMNDANLVQLRQDLDEVTRRIETHAPRSASTIGYSVAPWRASDILAKLSDGRLREVRLAEGGRQATVLNRHGSTIRQSDLNEVDRRLLSISLQLAAVAGVAQWGLRLPLVVADPFAELPAAESAILALVLQDLGRAGHQVLVSTSSTAVVDRLRSTGQAILTVGGPQTPSTSEPVTTGLRAFQAKTITTPIEVEEDQEDNGCALSLDDSIDRFAVFGEDTKQLFSAIGIHEIRDLLDADADDVSHALDRTGISGSIVELWQTHVAMLVYVPDLTLHDAQLLTSAGVRNLQQLADADAEELHEAMEEYLASPRGVRYRSRQGMGLRQVSRWIANAGSTRARWASTPYASRTANGTTRKVSQAPAPNGRRRSSTNGTRRAVPSRKERPLRFRLSRKSPVVDAPSIGPKTAKRLQKVGVQTVADLLSADCDALAESLDVRHINAETLVTWQHQAQLMCRVPELLARDVQVIVGCGFTTPEGIASAKASDLLEFAKSYLATPEGARALRNGEAPDLARVKKWIYWAENRRELEAA
ncbi:DUF4332 domain-containing protein [Aeoliella mucimassa]|nr:DUF4332 domain-containing protein [Aeoliella mucimassa]